MYCGANQQVKTTTTATQVFKPKWKERSKEKRNKHFIAGWPERIWGKSTQSTQSGRMLLLK